MAFFFVKAGGRQLGVGFSRDGFRGKVCVFLWGSVLLEG